MPAKVRPSTTAMSDSDEEPGWDTTPLTFNHWYTELPDHLESLDPDYVTMFESGFCMDKKVCVAPTEYHAVAIRDRFVRTDRNPVSGTPFAEPEDGIIDSTSSPSVFSPGGTNQEAYEDFVSNPAPASIPKTKNNPAGRSPHRTRQRVANEGGMGIAMGIATEIAT